ncbi:unnamed protein product [Protopolystoma xenopodis]|uniref:Uncharacterized protein n=1 Tax=Protopolystoma xenopodis TaxID=117903 RepID=A0A3S4ZRT9_9PLAT|nr:unnamed protein product [Protopolystoma xenopodis]
MRPRRTQIYSPLLTNIRRYQVQASGRLRIDTLSEGSYYTVCLRSDNSFFPPNAACTRWPTVFDQRKASLPIESKPYTVAGFLGLYVVSHGSNWAQLGWRAPNRDLQGGPIVLSPPVAYLLFVLKSKRQRCPEQIHFFAPPWVSQPDDRISLSTKMARQQLVFEPILHLPCFSYVYRMREKSRTIGTDIAGMQISKINLSLLASFRVQAHSVTYDPNPRSEEKKLYASHKDLLDYSSLFASVIFLLKVQKFKSALEILNVLPHTIHTFTYLKLSDRES